MENKPNECTNNQLDINLQSACDCKDRVNILGIPDEYFYNTCDCLNCDCTEEENYCGCAGTMSDPLGTNHQSCICQNLNVFE